MDELQCEVAGGLEGVPPYLAVQNSVWAEQRERL